MAAFAGWAPHLDLEPLAPSELPLIDDVLTAPWIHAGQEARAIARAAAELRGRAPAAFIGDPAHCLQRRASRCRRGAARGV